MSTENNFGQFPDIGEVDSPRDPAREEMKVDFWEANPEASFSWELLKGLLDKGDYKGVRNKISDWNSHPDTGTGKMIDEYRVGNAVIKVYLTGQRPRFGYSNLE